VTSELPRNSEQATKDITSVRTAKLLWNTNEVAQIYIKSELQFCIQFNCE
jgi:hypothetical protein